MKRQPLACAVSIFLFLLLPAISAAQTRYPVQIVHTGSDQVGLRYAFELREAIRGSKGMTLVNDGLDPPRIKVSLVTIDTESSGERGVASAIAVTLLYDSIDIPAGGAHLTTVVHVCGRDRVASCARDLLARIDAQVAWLEKNWPSLWKTLYR